LDRGSIDWKISGGKYGQLVSEPEIKTRYLCADIKKYLKKQKDREKEMKSVKMTK
jgi:hypothetical protein